MHKRLRNYNVREVTMRKDSSTLVGNIYARNFARPDISLIDDAKYQVFIVTEQLNVLRKKMGELITYLNERRKSIYKMFEFTMIDT